MEYFAACVLSHRRPSLRGTTPAMTQTNSFSRRLCVRVLPKEIQQPPSKRREVERQKAHPTSRVRGKRRCRPFTHRRGARPYSPSSPACGGGLGGGAHAFRRSTAALARGFRPAGSTPGHASWDVDPAGVTRLHLSQSRDCTSRTGRSTGVTDARSRPGAGRNAARRDRSRSTFESTLAKGPSGNETRVMYLYWGSMSRACIRK
jgi:hypothetical protein